MPVFNRIKIIKCCNFDEAETKVNDFLAFDKDIAGLVHIDYRLEYNVVIIEYYTFSPHQQYYNNNNNNNNEISKYNLLRIWDEYNKMICAWWGLD